MALQFVAMVGMVTATGLLCREQIQDAPIAYGYGIILIKSVAGFHRDHPVGKNKCVYLNSHDFLQLMNRMMGFSLGFEG
jgi:hypothetical protein